VVPGFQYPVKPSSLVSQPETELTSGKLPE
jgi:hypothetical protein